MANSISFFYFQKGKSPLFACLVCICNADCSVKLSSNCRLENRILHYATKTDVLRSIWTSNSFEKEAIPAQGALLQVVEPRITSFRLICSIAHFPRNWNEEGLYAWIWWKIVNHSPFRKEPSNRQIFFIFDSDIFLYQACVFLSG